MHRFESRGRLVRIAHLAGLALVAVVTLGVSYPKPAPVPYRWELQFDAGDLRLHQDASSGQFFWFFTYTITNRSGKTQLWAPRFVLFTDGGDIIEAGRDVPTRVTEELLEMLGNPLLEDQNSILGDLLQGRENAREGLVVWAAKNTQVTELSMFIAGISGETARVKNPVTGEETIMRKTLQRDYHIPGDPVKRGSRPVDMVDQRWILR